MDDCVVLLALPSCWFLHVARQFAATRMRITAGACADCFFRLRRCRADAQIELARRVRTLAICPNFLEIGLRFLKQDHSRFAVFSAVIRELDRGFHGFALRKKYRSNSLDFTTQLSSRLRTTNWTSAVLLASTLVACILRLRDDCVPSTPWRNLGSLSGLYGCRRIAGGVDA